MPGAIIEDLYLTKLFYMAFLFFNRQLFDSELGMLFLQIRRRRTNRILGTYFVQPTINDHNVIHINKKFVYRASLITLVHEMTHHWRHNCAHKVTRIHHDKYFKEKMRSFGFVMPQEIPLANGSFYLAQNAFLHILGDIACHKAPVVIFGEFVCQRCGNHVLAGMDQRPQCAVCHLAMPLYSLTLEAQPTKTALAADEYGFAAFCGQFLARYTCPVRMK